MTTHAQPPSNWSLMRPYLIDVAGPFIAYGLIRAFGAPGFWAMTAAGAVAAISAAYNSLRRKKLDAVGALVLLEILAAIGVMIFVRDPRFLLVRPSIYTAVAAIFLICSALAGRPMTVAGARTMAARGGEARLAAYDRAWQSSRPFRRTHLLVTTGFGVCLAVDSVLRIFIVYNYPIERSAWLSNLPHVTAILLMTVTSALAGRRFSRLVDDQM